MVIAIEGDANGTLLLAEQANHRLGIGRPLGAIGLVDAQLI